MSIKKEITAAMSTADTASVELNKITRLDVMRKDGAGNDCDIVRVHFSYIGGIRGGATYDLIEREYDKLLAEISQKTRLYLNECAEALSKNLVNGVR